MSNKKIIILKKRKKKEKKNMGLDPCCTKLIMSAYTPASHMCHQKSSVGPFLSLIWKFKNQESVADREVLSAK